MALFQATGYPYYIAMPQGDYTINLDKKPIYAGRAYPFPNQSTINLDVSAIVRNAVPCPDFSIVFAQNKTNINGLLHGVSVITPEKTIALNYLWNYDKDNYSGVKEDQCLGDYITPWIYLNQIVPFNVLTYNDISFTVIANLPLTSMDLVEFSNVGSDTSLDVRTMAFKNTYSTLTNDVSIYLSRDGSVIKDSELTCKSCVPTNTYTLYYVNMKGALSFVHCDCKNVTKNNVTRSSYSHENQYDKPWAFGSTNYLNQVSRTWTLNTNFLNDLQSTKIQELFKSPRVWIYDYTTQLATAVNVTDTSVEVKNRLNNHLFNYTINVKESQTYDILG